MHKKMLSKSNIKFVKTLFDIFQYHNENFGNIFDNSGKHNKTKFFKFYLSKKKSSLYNIKLKYKRYE